GMTVNVANAIAVSLVQSGQGGWVEVRVPRQNPLIDPDTDQPLRVHDGTYEGGREGQVLWDGVWTDRETAAKWIRERRGEIADRRRERGIFEKESQRATEQWRKDRAEAHRREREELARQKAAREAEVAERLERERSQGIPDGFAEGFRGWDNTTLGWWVNVLGGTVSGGWNEFTDIPRQAVEAAGYIYDELTDFDNWRVVKEGTRGSIGDIIGLGMGDAATAKKVGGSIVGGVKAIGSIAGHAAGALLTDPVEAVGEFIKLIGGVENWKKVVDGDRPLLERWARALWGAVETGGTIYGVRTGVSALGRKVTKIVKGTDALSDLGKGAGAARRATGLLDDTGVAAKGARAADASGEAGLGRRIGRGADAAEEAGDVGRGAAASREAGDGIPRMRTDPEGYIHDLPNDAIVDQNLLSGSGYTGRQMDALKKVARENNVLIGTRTTNAQSMAKIRDGIAVPKP
ncbi:MAG: hypothetical protein GY728_14450, partial [Phycisphaeraceae bacterium]|nr:hypothetical protein [Phycisphaeraceae bacterium]